MDLIQWNVNGYPVHRQELQVIICKFTPAALCLQEISFNQVMNLICVAIPLIMMLILQALELVATWLCVWDNVHSTQVPLHWTIQATAICVILTSIMFTVCSLLPKELFDTASLTNLLKQLAATFFLVSGFNTCHFLWGLAHDDRQPQWESDLTS